MVEILLDKTGEAGLIAIDHYVTCRRLAAGNSKELRYGLEYLSIRPSRFLCVFPAM